MSTRGIYLFQHSEDPNFAVHHSCVHAAYIHHDSYPSGAAELLENWVNHSVEHQVIKTEWPITFESFIRCNKRAEVVPNNWRREDYNFLYIIKWDSHKRLSLNSPMDVYKKELTSTMPSYDSYQNTVYFSANITMTLGHFINSLNVHCGATT